MERLTFGVIKSLIVYERNCFVTKNLSITSLSHFEDWKKSQLGPPSKEY